MTIVITDDDVRRLLTMEECIEAMRVAFADFADGKAANMPRMRYSVDTADPNKRYLANIQAGAVPSYGVASVRAGSRFMQFEEVDGQRRVKHNPGPKNWTVIVLYDLEPAEPLAFVHENHISGVRVGATVGVAVEKMAREDSHVLGLFGSGAQAGPMLEAICAVRPPTPVQCSRSQNEACCSAPGFLERSARTPLKNAASQRLPPRLETFCNAPKLRDPGRRRY